MSQSHAAEHVHHELGFWRKYVFSTDHKIIAIQYLITDMTLDGVCPAKRCTRGRTRTGNGPHALDYSHSALHRVGLDGRFELRYDDPHDANARPVDDAAPADAVVVVDYSHSGFARFSSASRRRNLAGIRPGRGDQLLLSGRNHHEPDADRPFRRPPAVMAASILVLRAS